MKPLLKSARLTVISSSHQTGFGCPAENIDLADFVEIANLTQAARPPASLATDDEGAAPDSQSLKTFLKHQILGSIPISDKS